jgi:hypothetical protein
MSRWAVDETGMNSVSPCRIPRRKEWKRFIGFREWGIVDREKGIENREKGIENRE